MRWALLALTVGIVLAAFGWLGRDRWLAHYPVIDPMVFFSAMPGGPMGRADPSTLDPRYFDGLGYQVAGPNRIAVAHSSKRPTSPANPYDMDLNLRVNAMVTDGAARQAFEQEAETDARIGHTKVVLGKDDELRADAVAAWCRASSSEPTHCVVAVRHGNYLLRYAGLLISNGLFPSERAFLAEVRRLDAHVVSALERAR